MIWCPTCLSIFCITVNAFLWCIYLKQSILSLSLSLYKCICMYMHTISSRVCVTLYGPPSSLPSAVSPLLRHALTQTPLRFIITAIILIVIANNRARLQAWSHARREDSDDQRRLKRTEESRAIGEDGERLSGEEPGGHRPRVSAGERLCARVSAGLGARCGGRSPGCAPLVFASVINRCDALCVIAGPCWYFWAGGSGRQWHLRTSIQGRCGLSFTTFTKSFTASSRQLHYSFTAFLLKSRALSEDGCDLLRMRRDTQCDKKTHWL